MAGDDVENWKDAVRDKLVSLFGTSDHDTLLRVLYYLDEEDREYHQHGNEPAPAWRTLKATLSLDIVFKKFATQLGEDTKTAKRDPQFRKLMNTVYTNMMNPSEESRDVKDAQGLSLVRLTDLSVAQNSGFMGLARAWDKIPAVSQRQMLELIPQLVTNSAFLSSVDEVVSLVSKAGGNVVMVSLAALSLSLDIILNMRRWWKGEISGKRCVKNIMDSLLTVGAGVVGGMAGAAIGTTMGGPIGTVIGGVIGGILCGQGMNVLSDRMTQQLFGVPKEASLENAYRFFGVHMSASNAEINTEFRKLCFKHHPDKGGSVEDFHMVQFYMGAIKLARREM